MAGSWLLSAEPLEFSFILSGLEETYGDPEVFRAFCHRFREEHPQARDSPLVQWFLEPAAVGAIREPPLLHRSEFTTSLSPDWTWQDPFDDCSFSVQNGLEIHAANSRDLYHINLSAPRLLRSVRADFVAQTVCVPGSKEKPTIGGLLLWKDRQNYLRLNRGYAGKRDILFGGCLANQDVIIGRGRLPAAASERVYLRLERSGERVDAFCSADGEAWFTAGHTEFPVEDSIQVGLYAIGNIDRGVYHGAYPDGTAIRFESFQLWGLNH